MVGYSLCRENAILVFLSSAVSSFFQLTQLDKLLCKLAYSILFCSWYTTDRFLAHIWQQTSYCTVWMVAQTWSGTLTRWNIVSSAIDSSCPVRNLKYSTSNGLTDLTTRSTAEESWPESFSMCRSRTCPLWCIADCKTEDTTTNKVACEVFLDESN